MLWTALLENLSVVAGEYTYYQYMGQLFPRFPGYLFWVGAVPLWILLGWFIVAMSGYIIFHDTLLNRSRGVIQAAAAGPFAVDVDLMLDPSASSNGLWVWLSGSFRFLGTPIVNFCGWFLLVFFYYLIAQDTIFSNRPLPILSRVEQYMFRQSGTGADEPDLRKFIFRIVTVELLIFALLFYFAGFLDYLAGLGV
ncbi:MAG: carotenoid biosynthesis protein [Nitrososphaerota archaeon]|nr:carotenoid biosynthesis protein [Nitrososphaerota archaeon]MDG7023182.1 carotenoid biosynthesis protein [Nitrososphaerota archaeon]